MKGFGRPKNRWGWVRLAGAGALAGVLAWTGLAALLRQIGGLPWMAWSGYQAFPFLDGLELAALPLLIFFFAQWLEEHDHRVQTEHAHHHEAEKAAALQRGEILKRVQAAVLAALGEPALGVVEVPAEIPEAARARMHAAIHEALPALDGIGKGELLHFLFEKGLASGEKPALTFDGADFREAVLLKALLNGICLEGIDLRKARLDGAQMAKSQLGRGNLRKARLRHAILREASLPGCDLSGAHLEHASLEGADLRDAKVEGTFLSNANMRHCIFNSLAALDLAILIDTTLPDGRKMTNAKGKEYLRAKEIAVLVDRL